MKYSEKKKFNIVWNFSVKNKVYILFTSYIVFIEGCDNIKEVGTSSYYHCDNNLLGTTTEQGPTSTKTMEVREYESLENA